ncbi:MAG TPA: GFA family protein [Polyangiales bacterium]|nr:GFA family protein [Polyangiales bacterium]
MIRGSCVCGDVQFEIDRLSGPFELCHCSRCRRFSGSAFLAAVGVKREHFRFTSGRQNIQTYDAPILREPPAYRTAFCRRCGSATPDPALDCEWFEVPAGALEGELGVHPERHIMTHLKANWFEIRDDLPQLDLEQLERFRSSLLR